MHLFAIIEAKVESFDVGAAQVNAEGWPSSWLAYAGKSYFPQHRTNRTLTVRREGRREPEEPTCPGAYAWIGAHATLSLGLPPDLSGSYNEEAQVLQLFVPEGDPTPRLTLENGLRLFLATWLPYRWQGLMLHAAAGVSDGKGVVFPGVSTAGKSTMALGFEATEYLSDDIALVEGLGAEARLVGAPFFGVSGRPGAPTVAPLAAIGLLSHGAEQTTLRKLSLADAATGLLRHVLCFSEDPAVYASVLARVEELVSSVPVFEVQRSLSDPSDAVVERLLTEAGC